MTFYDKIKWVLGILMVFVLIVTTNLVDRNNFQQVKDSVVSIYEDRLVAKNLILDVTKAIHKTEVALISADTTFFAKERSELNSAIEGLILRFEQTKLTEKEEQEFNDLKSNLEKLYESEKIYVQANFNRSEPVTKSLSEVKENLNALAQIQMSEGARQMSISKRALDSVELFTQMEIALLVILAIIIQVIVIYKPKSE